ncbi:MAG: hypothetical protein KME29_23305 [Calothrix sp. FI2-JRJ7]|nr:hypothetical protein [Calothrix sp. FI2-JRJ7]
MLDSCGTGIASPVTIVGWVEALRSRSVPQGNPTHITYYHKDTKDTEEELKLAPA